MKLVAIGHLCIDVSHRRGGPETRVWGGIANTIATLGTLAGKNDTIVPLCSVGAEEHQSFVHWLERFPAVDASGVFPVDGRTNTIHIYEQENGTRIACAMEIAQAIVFDRVRKFLSADGIVINMASGSDITLDTLDQVRMEVRPRGTPIHFDYHNLTMGVNGQHERFRRALPDWRRWAFMVHTVQMNEEEAGGLSMEKMTELQTVGHLLTLGIRGVIVTRGHRGATLFTNEHKRVVRKDVGADPAVDGADATGLGDVLGAAFLYHCVGSSDLAASLEFSVRIAGAAATRPREERWATPAVS